MNVIRWGILGTGYAATQFAQGLRALPEAQLLAVGSRQLQTAQTFAHQFKIERSYQGYEQLVADKDIDIVYIATPNILHKDHCLLALEAGKAVLCEKPFTINAQQAREVVDYARQKQVFCMEAMWTRFIPLWQQVRTLIQSGQLGEIKLLLADLSMQLERDPQSRHFNPQVGGGVLLDLGVYLVAIAFDLLGEPLHISSQGVIGSSQVDEQAALIFHYPQGELAVLSSSFVTHTPNEAIISGTQGQIRIHAPLYRPFQYALTSFAPPTTPKVTTSNPGWKTALKQNPWVRSAYDIYLAPRLKRTAKQFTVPYHGNGYHYQAAEAMHCVTQGLYESPLMPLEETIMILEAMDTIRAQWQFQFPSEVKQS